MDNVLLQNCVSSSATASNGTIVDTDISYSSKKFVLDESYANPRDSFVVRGTTFDNPLVINEDSRTHTGINTNRIGMSHEDGSASNGTAINGPLVISRDDCVLVDLSVNGQPTARGETLGQAKLST